MRTMAMITALFGLALILALSACGERSVPFHYDLLGNGQPLSHRMQWEENAIKGDVEAQYEYGKSFCCGFDGYYDTKLALEWICKAARKRYPEAMYAVAEIYNSHKDAGRLGDAARDPRLPSNDALAYAWYSAAAIHEYPGAQQRLTTLAGRLKRDQLTLAKHWITKYPNIPCEYQPPAKMEPADDK
ncbi:MAG: sel1 repeat family protein [Rickettsiales bacterium]|nr:sel1 repeat family protein [Rickettsiales bacterium]